MSEMVSDVIQNRLEQEAKRIEDCCCSLSEPSIETRFRWAEEENAKLQKNLFSFE